MSTKAYCISVRALRTPAGVHMVFVDLTFMVINVDSYVDIS